MPKTQLRLFTLLSLTGLVGVLSCHTVGLSQSTPAQVQLTTTPTDRLLPFNASLGEAQSPTTLQVQLDRLKSAQVRLRLLTPPPNPWSPTDFPIVEGTPLLDMTVNTSSGMVALQQMLPIRGNYQLLVTATPTDSGATTQQTFTLPVSENDIKYRNLAILAVILVLAGLGGGWILGGAQTVQPDEIAPQRVRLLLSGAAGVAIVALLFMNISAELAESHRGHSHAHSHSHDAVPLPALLEAQGLKLQLLGDREAIVGQLARFTAQVTDLRTGQPVTDVQLKIRAVQQEDGWTTLAYSGMPDNQGQLTWQQQFFDGAPHRVEVEVAPQPGAARQFQPLRVAQDVEVESIAPPLTGRLIALGYFTGIFLVGLLLGLKLRSHPPKPMTHEPAH